MPIMRPKTPPLRDFQDVINNQYTVVQLIGKVATGEVYIVKDKDNPEQQVALKYMKLDPEYKPALDHFKSEFDTMTHLNHPHIAKVFDFGWDDELKYYFFTSELIEGFDFINAAKNLDIEKIELLLIQSLRALEYLHGHGIFHYDIKPHNILVQDAYSQSPNVKVIDFGLATAIPHEKIVGTPSYIAPEVIQRQKSDGRADLYSLGVLAYVVLTGVNPFRGKTNEETFKNHLTVTPIEPSVLKAEIPQYLNKIIMKLIEKNPDDRYSTPSEVIQDINFRSPNLYSIETPDTLLSYVPWEGPFIGRKKYLEDFKNWLENTESKESTSVFWIQGNIGSGKSRFAEECKNRAQLDGFQTISSKNEIDFSLIAKLEKLSKKSVVILDNLDELLKVSEPQNTGFFSKLITGKNIVIASSNLANSRKEVEGYLSEIECKEIETVTIDNFSIEELLEYIKDLTGIKEIPNWLVHNLYSFTGGNPLFLTETMKQMIESGLLFDQAGRWKKTTLEDFGLDLSLIEIPSTLINRFSDFCNAIDTSEKEVASLISTWRGPIPINAISEILNDHEEALESLIEKGIITINIDPNKLSFQNVMTQKICYASISNEERRHFHDRIKEYMEANNASPSIIMHHIQRGSDPEIAKATLLEAIKSSNDFSVVYEDAEEFLSRFSDSMNDDVFDIYLKKAKYLVGKRDMTNAYATYQALLIILPNQNEVPKWHFDTHIALASLYKQERKVEEALSHIKKAKEIAKMMDDAKLEIIVQNHLAGVDIIMNNLNHAIQTYETSRDSAKKLSKSDQEEIRNNDLGHAYLYRGDYEKAVGVLKEDEKKLRKSNIKDLLSRTLYSLGEAYQKLNKFKEAESVFEESIELSKELGNTERLFRAYNGMGNLLTAMKKYEEGTGYFERALDLALHLNHYDSAAGVMLNIGVATSNTTNIKKAINAFQSAIAFLSRHGIPVSMRERYLCRAHLELAELLRIEKKLDEADGHLTEALNLTNIPQAEQYHFYILYIQARVALDRENIDLTNQIIEKAEKLATNDQMKSLLKDLKENMSS